MTIEDRRTMYVNEVNANSPIRILERYHQGGLSGGELGVVMARAGVGKTAFLVQVALDDAMREQPVLHVALGQDLEHVQSWYDALFDDLAQVTNLADREQVRALVKRNRVIHAFADTTFSHKRLDEVVDLYERAQFTPAVILIDGLNWEEGTVDQRSAELRALKLVAKRLGAVLWLSAQTHRDVTPVHPTELIPPCAEHRELIDVAVFLEPEDTHISVRLLKDHEHEAPADTRLRLHADTMRLAQDEAVEPEVSLPSRLFALLSGGANGAEAAFGEAAERWGLGEVNFSFAGRETARKRGVVELSEAELERGSVSTAYIKAQLHRSFPDTRTFQLLLKSIWHQVSTAGEVFVVGEILDDDTVKGGTGWGAELAKHLKKPVYVFDQPKGEWFHWQGDGWVRVENPKIRRTRFTGTGTRFLGDAGRKAIEDLFERSFGERHITD
jgi:KaiC/GvpD/RAD55 family RecA-like ATPase